VRDRWRTKRSRKTELEERIESGARACDLPAGTREGGKRCPDALRSGFRPAEPEPGELLELTVIVPARDEEGCLAPACNRS